MIFFYAAMLIYLLPKGYAFAVERKTLEFVALNHLEVRLI